MSNTCIILIFPTLLYKIIQKERRALRRPIDRRENNYICRSCILPIDKSTKVVYNRHRILSRMTENASICKNMRLILDKYAN